MQAERVRRAGDAALAAAQKGATEVQEALDRDRATLAAEAQRLQVSEPPPRVEESAGVKFRCR